MANFILYGRRGWGSVLAEAQLVWYNMAFEFHTVGDLFADQQARQSLTQINPLAQIPTLVLPNGSVLTESAAITLWLAEQAGSDDLVPESTDPQRSLFLRWLIFITSNIYPTYTYADHSAQFVWEESSQSRFEFCVYQYAERLYSILNTEASTPWFLGHRFSAIDIYICAMTHWNHPGQSWFSTHAPKLFAIAATTRTLPQLSNVWEQNYPKGHESPNQA